MNEPNSCRFMSFPTENHLMGRPMADPTPNRPLWQVMRDISYTVDALGIGSTDQFAREVAAAELRAIADWLVPEEPEPQRTLNVEPERDVAFIGAWQIWNTRRQLRHKLLAEAYRAEVGE